MRKVRYDDLIGLPFLKHSSGPDGYDCIGVVREVYRRAGWSDASLPTIDNEGAYSAACADEVAGGPISSWDRIDSGDNGSITERLEFGDVVVMVMNGGTHISVVTDDSRQVALSAAESLGVYAYPTCRLRNVTGVYRLSEAAR